MLTLNWLTAEEAAKSPLLKAIWDKPGISRVELAERGLIKLQPQADGRDKLQTQVVEGKVIPKDGGYYPYLPQYVPKANQKQPPLKVWRDPSMVGAEGRAVTKAIASAVMAVSVAPEPAPVTPADWLEEEPETVEVEAVEVTESAPVQKRRNPPCTSRKEKLTARNYQRIREVVAELERKGEPFTLNAILVRAGLASSYLHKDCHQELRAELETIVSRVTATYLGVAVDANQQPPKRNELSRLKVLEVISRLEAKGERFNRTQILDAAGVGHSFYPRNPDLSAMADQAIARTVLKTSTSETVSEPIKSQEFTMPEPEPVRLGFSPSVEAQDRLNQAVDELTQERQGIAAEFNRVNQKIRRLEATEKNLIERQQWCDRLLRILQGGTP